MKNLYLQAALLGSLISLSIVGQCQTTVSTVTLQNSNAGDTTTVPLPTTTPTTTIDSNEYKLVYWIHGLSGSYHSLSHLQVATQAQGSNPISNYPERKTIGKTVAYNGKENTNLIGLSAYVNNDLIFPWAFVRPNYDHNRSFIISHSQGGLVARTMTYLTLDDSIVNKRRYGGVVTFGTPHGGAQIINSVDGSTGEAQAWLENGCHRMADAELQTYINKQKWYVNTFITPTLITEFTSHACQALRNMVLPTLIGSIRKPVTIDYAVGAPHLDLLDSIASHDTLPAVAFYGIEQEPVLWRLLNTMTYDQDTTPTGSILVSNPFGLGADEHLPNEINTIHAQYQFFEDFYMHKFNHWIGHAGFFGKRWDWFDSAEKYRKAHIWLGSANGMWKRFIGARYDSTYQNGYYCYCENEVIPTWVSDPAHCNSQVFNICYTVPNIEVHVTDIPNDGVVTAASQKAYPNATYRIKMPTSNHFQERTTLETRDRLNELFDGQYGEQFHLNKK